MGEGETTILQTDVIVNSDGSITLDDITVPPAPRPALTIEATKERLIITELQVRDFKSYAGTHVIGPFHKNFSCIVGPNGSGKSNVIDALLFVFGYRAQRIRSKKVSVLIHKSHKFPDLSSCSVTVHFAMIKDEDMHFIKVPDSDFSITRTGFKDNSSVYEINGKRSQYKDVASLLKSYGVDLEYNRFMVLQGEIELISMMKPKATTEQDSGMLEYIEDIIGSTRFIEPIQHFHSKMEEVNERRLEKMSQLKIVERERNIAEKPRNEAMEYLRLANKLALMENSVYQAEIYLASEDGERLNKKKNDIEEKVKEVSTKLEEVETLKLLKESELREITDEFENCSKIVKDYQQQFTALEHSDAACRENLKNNKEKIKKLTKNLETEEAKIPKLKKQPEILRGEILELEEKKQTISNLKAAEEEKLTEVMGSMKNEIQGYQEEKDILENELVELQVIVTQKKSELDLAQSELDICLSSENKEKEKLCNLQSELEKVISTIADEEKAIRKATERLPEIKSKLQSATEELTEKEKAEAQLNAQLKNLRVKHDEAVNSLNSSSNLNSLTKAFLQEKKKGNLMGVYGRLGDLGAIDSKFDIAISTACGALDHIVTDTIITAQECVDFLKKNNLGYTTFIALDKMKKWEPYTQQKISTPENVPRLFDLITVKNKDILPAFYFALGDTLVADSLEQATRVGLQGSSRYRVVTLKGEVIDLSGTMSGGGGKVAKGRMGQAVAEASTSKEEVDQLAKEIEQISLKLTDVKRVKIELRDIIEQSTKEISLLSHSLKKNEMNHIGYVDQKKNLMQQIEEQKKKIISAEADKNEVKRIEAKIYQGKKAYEDAVNVASVVENKVKNLQDQILAITKGKYGTVQKKIDNLNKDIAQITQNITKNTVLEKNCEKNLKKAEDKIASYKEEIEVCQKERETFVEEFKSLEVKGAEVTEKKKEAEDALKLCEIQKMQITAEIKSLTGNINQIKSDIRDLKNQIKLTDTEIQANEGQIRMLREQISRLELQEIEEGPFVLPILTPEELQNLPIKKTYIEIGRLKNRITEMNPDLGTIAEFRRKEEIYRQKLRDLEETVVLRDHYRNHYEALRKLRRQEFMKGFNIITLKVKELYQMMTLGGDAELDLIDSLDPFSEGIEYSVRPLRKSWKSVRNLSGGEKTLSSLSLIFALHYYRTTPFFVMDEIDAALDFRNVSIIGSYIKDCTKNAQFIVISLRENMFLLADHLVGIYKTNNRTKNIYLSPPIVSESSDDSITELTKGKKTCNETKNENGLSKTNKVTFRSPEKEQPNIIPDKAKSNCMTKLELSNQETSNSEKTDLTDDNLASITTHDMDVNLFQQDDDDDSLVIGDEALKENDSLSEMIA